MLRRWCYQQRPHIAITIFAVSLFRTLFRADNIYRGQCYISLWYIYIFYCMLFAQPVKDNIKKILFFYPLFFHPIIAVNQKMAV